MVSSALPANCASAVEDFAAGILGIEYRASPWPVILRLCVHPACIVSRGHGPVPGGFLLREKGLVCDPTGAALARHCFAETRRMGPPSVPAIGN
jgi:hypothetical protein